MNERHSNKRDQELEQDSLQLSDEKLEWNILSDLLHRSYNQQQEVWERVRADCFYHKITHDVYRCIGYYVEKGEQADSSNVGMMCQMRHICDLPTFLDKIDQFIGYRSILETWEHINILGDYKKRRTIFEISQHLRHEGLQVGENLESVIERVKEDLTDVVNGDKTTNTSSMQDVLNNLSSIVKDNLSGKNDGLKTKSGFAYIDDKGGLIPTDLIIIAGASSMGKTSFADSVVLNAIQEGAKILFFSLEMSKEQLTARMLSKYTKINSRKQLYSKLDEYEIRQFDKGVGTLWECASNLFFDDDSTSNLDDICSSIRKHKAKYDIRGAVIDYLQLVGGQERGENNETFLARISRKLKNLAKDLGIWIIALSQIHRDKDNYVPTMNMIRGSGQIAEAADVILLLYRPEYYNKKEGKNFNYPYPNEKVQVEGTALVIQAKGRNDGDGSFICGFDASTTHFYDFVGSPPMIASVPLNSNATSNNVAVSNVEMPF